MKAFFTLLLLWVALVIGQTSRAQKVVQVYHPAKNDSIRVGTGVNDFLPYIEKGYTLMLPNDRTTKGVLIFLEDSDLDNKNSDAKLVYDLAAKNGFAVLSVSSEIPLDFYFTESSMASTHHLIEEAFEQHDLPNENVFFLGASLVGHRAMRYITYLKEKDPIFQLQIRGLVICNFTLDWTRKWYQHQRDFRIDKINLWEPTFINFMLETYLNGTPKTQPQKYHDFSAYSYFDLKNTNIGLYKDYAIRAYIKPDIKYRLRKYHRSLYDNNAPDIVGFLAELRLAGNENTDLIVIHPEELPSRKKESSSIWQTLDKTELMDWIMEQAVN